MSQSKPIPSMSPVTVRSIAARAGVSAALVSSVLNNLHVERRVAARTVDKVRHIASEMGYVPNIGARRLRRGGGARHTVVLAIVTSFEAPITLVKDFLFALRHLGSSTKTRESLGPISVLIEMFSAGRLREMPNFQTGDHFNGAIVLNTTPVDDAYLGECRLQFPVVLVNRIIPGFFSVAEAPNAGARAAEIFVKARRKRLGVLHGSPLTQITRTRTFSFIDRAVSLSDRTIGEVVATTLSETAGYEAMRAYLAEREPLDALYSVSDSLALGAYRAIKEAGLRIPQDVAVIGVGDYEIASFFDPALSCIGAKRSELAEQACRLLLAQLVGGTRPRQQLEIPVMEELRTSSGHR